MKRQQQRSPNASCRGRHNGASREGSGKVDVPAQPGVHGRGGADGRHLSEPQLFPRWPSQALLVDAQAPAEQARVPTQMRDLTSLT